LIYNDQVKDIEDLRSQGVFLWERVVIFMFIFPAFCPFEYWLRKETFLFIFTLINIKLCKYQEIAHMKAENNSPKIFLKQVL
jgi:hypothetical protein